MHEATGRQHAVRVRVRIAELHRATLMAHLVARDGLESVAIVLCGRAGSEADEVLVVHEVVPMMNDVCVERSPVWIRWRTEHLPAILTTAERRGLAIIKIHSHPTGHESFSMQDNRSDRELFPGVYGWCNSDRPHVSAVMLPNGKMLARVVWPDGSFGEVASVACIGEQIEELLLSERADKPGSPSSLRTRQAFGDATTEKLSSMSIAVVGCSGTGSWTCEMLARLEVGELVIVDPDVVEPLNLNRIVHATVADANERALKVRVMKRAIERIGLGTRVDANAEDVATPRMVRRLSRCDAIIGCVDDIIARDVLSRTANFYALPYFDVGVRLIADGIGGIRHIAGGVQYVYPGSPSLSERGVYSPRDLANAGLRKSDPSAHDGQIRAKYISGVRESRPAVATVNSFYASMAVNELLHRIHPYRDVPAPLGAMISLTQLRVVLPSSDVKQPSLSKHVGRGDARPLLGLPMLTEP